MQHAHLSFIALFCTRHVSHVHFVPTWFEANRLSFFLVASNMLLIEVGANGNDGFCDECELPGLIVMQQTHFSLLSAFETRHIVHVHLF